MHLELGASRLMGAWLLLVHGMPLLLLPLLHWPLWASLITLAAVLYNLQDSWRRHARRSHPQAVRQVAWQDTGTARLTLESGELLDVTLATQAFIQPWLVILHFRTPRRGFRYLPVLPDMMDVDTFRQLRVRLQIAMARGTA